MIVHQSTTSDGRVIFISTQCSFCQMDSAGNHNYLCPNRPDEDNKIFISDPVEDYNDPTEPA